ncbi:PREDICTED: uncharacterized protein LOC108755288 [Trachymyrmex septentrionalis]|uniref:uncharacterized protein LOC108755288 n=1 Tax=Trachymyrmex septentrionalis TaxID=34720 RepID=UPI00084ED30D|nr:PREDICTED: uncharacterized protein LOC108755288 [Trachymyrmex septentrionalis]
MSSVGSPLHSLATFLHKKLFKTIPRADSYMKNSFELVERLRDVHFTGTHELTSLDVTSLFTNVPTDVAIDCVNEHWRAVSIDCSLPKKEFLGAIQFVLDSSFFVFDNVFYRQSFGTPMGSPISPVIADLVLRRLETVSLMSVNLDILFYYRYVDDICTALPPSQIDVLLERFNAFHPRLQFTVERGGKTINFLDVSVNNNRFNFDWYRKPTFSGRFLNFHSNHPLTQKKGTIFSLVDRAFLLSDFKFHTKNLTAIIDILLLNDYPLEKDFIFDSINHRIKNLIRNRHRLHDTATDIDSTNKSASWLTVSFIPLHTEKLRSLNKSKSDIRVAFRSPNKMGKYIRVQKDSCPSTSKSNVVYKILYEEPSYRKRLISEMLHIKKQRNSLNLQTDTEGLNKAYLPIINKV